MAKTRGDNATGDLFGEFVPVRRQEPLAPALDLKRGIATVMGAAIRDSGKSTAVIAAEMTELLGDDEIITTAQLYAYTSEARTSHTISIVRWIAFVRATGQLWVWDWLLKAEGLVVLQGAEALHVEASMAEAQARQLQQRARRLRAVAPLEFSIKQPPSGRRGK